ncbi:MAG: response regulator [Saprospiraceae bacterium]|nr:response regulator [Saprospiraceae bacterium]MCB9309209.1 response regulator [Lewinellaceae bacterium]
MASGTFKILIVDDEPNIVMAIKHILEDERFTLYEANDGETALKLVKDTDPHLIILDVMMPGMDGFAVAKSIIRSENSADTKILFLTAKGTSKDKLQGYASGGESYMIKPFDNDDLLNQVLYLLELE